MFRRACVCVDSYRAYSSRLLVAIVVVFISMIEIKGGGNNY